MFCITPFSRTNVHADVQLGGSHSGLLTVGETHASTSNR